MRPRASGNIFGLEWVDASGLSVSPANPAKASLPGLWPRVAECGSRIHTLRGNMKADEACALLIIWSFLEEVTKQCAPGP